MNSTSTVAAVVLVVTVMIGAYVMSVARQSADLLIVQATTASIAPARLVAEWMLGRLDHCPDEDFHPTTPLGFIVAGWEQSGDAARSERMLDLLLASGCAIDSYGGPGLTPLHSAILFNNLNAVQALLRRGADRNLRTAIQSGDDGRAIALDALAFAHYLESTGSDYRSAIVDVLE